ncbi:MAG: ABC transporter ATP-binding protein [Burkholderiales bacterium]
MNELLLNVQGLFAGYGEVPVLQNIHIEVRRGEIVALVGSNGAGKTTLLRALSRVLSSTGTLAFDGHDLGGLTPEQAFRRGIVQVPEGRQLFDKMTVLENLLMGAFARNDRQKIQETLESVYALFPKLYERRSQRAGSLSGGEQQMCAIGRALMAAPKLLMVDEMSLGLAPVIVDHLLEVLSTIRRQGVTVLLVEQDVFAALEVADRGYVMSTGTVTQSGTAKALSEDPEVKRAYLGI